MAGYDELDGGPPEAFDDIEVLLTGHPEDSIDALVLEGGNEKIRSLHVRSPLYIQRARAVPPELSGHVTMKTLEST
jgi:hypothetical protein